MPQSNRRRLLGTFLILIGLLLIVGVAGAFGWQQWQSAVLQHQLRAKAAEAAPVTQSQASLQPTGPAPSVVPTDAPTQVVELAPAPIAVRTPAQSPTNSPSPTATKAPPTPALAPTKPVRLAIPDLKIDVPVTDMGWKAIDGADGLQSEWVIPENTVGRAINSALLGEPGNLVVSGHNNIYGRVFMPVSQAWPGTGVEQVDEYTERSKILDGRKIVLEGADGRKFEYAITAFYRVKDSGVPLEQRLKNGKFMDPTTDTRLTLTTCWPPWSNTHRLIVIAQPVR